MKDTQDFFPFEERLMIEQTSDFYPCDLCDQMNLPHVSWHCTHDDPDHVTTICCDCINRLNRLPVMHKVKIPVEEHCSICGKTERCNC